MSLYLIQNPLLHTCQIHRELAREAVRKSLVLLKNGRDLKNPFLPLDKNARTILVAGIHADDIGYQCGGWTITWHGTGGRITIGTYDMMGLIISVIQYGQSNKENRHFMNTVSILFVVLPTILNFGISPF